MRNESLSCIVVAVMAFCFPSLAQSGTVLWGVDSGNWSVGTNWNSGSVPSSADDVSIERQNSTVTLDSAVSDIKTFTMSTTAGRTTTMNVSTGAALAVSPGSTGYTLGIGIGVKGVGGNGGTLATVNQTGGSVVAVDSSISIGNNGAASGTQGVYNISGGTLATTSAAENATDHRIIVGYQSDGTLNVSGSAVVSVGNNSNAGSLAQLSVGHYNAKGTVIQTGGTVSVAGDYVYLGAGRTGSTSNGTYTISGGTLTTTGIIALGGMFASASYGSGTGLLDVSDTGAVTAAEVIVGNVTGPTGTGSVGTVNQTGGSVTITGTTGLLLAYGGSTTGTYNLNGGVLTTTKIGRGSGTAAFNVNGGTIKAGAAFTSSVPMTINANGATVDTNGFNVTLSGNLLAGAGSGGLTKQGSATLTLSGANTYLGETIVNAGSLAYGANNVIASGGITVSGGTLALGAYSDTVGAVTLDDGNITGTGTLTSTSGFTVRSGSIDAAIAGNVGLVKNDAGLVSLSGIDTYTGNTIVNAGTLEQASTGSMSFDINTIGASTKILGTGKLVLNGKLVFDVSDAATGSWNVVSASTLNESYGDSFGVMFAIGSTTVSATETAPNSGVWTYSNEALGRATFTESTGVLSITTIPEPGAITMVITGLIGLIAYAWRRRK